MGQQGPTCSSPLTFVSLPHFSAAKFLSGGLCWECLGGGSPRSAWVLLETSPLSALERKKRVKTTRRWKWHGSQSCLLQTRGIGSVGLRLNFPNSGVGESAAGETCHHHGQLGCWRGGHVCRMSSSHGASLSRHAQRLPLPSWTCFCLLGLLTVLRGKIYIKVYNSVTFSTLNVLALIPEHCHHPKRKPAPLSSHSF